VEERVGERDEVVEVCTPLVIDPGIPGPRDYEQRNRDEKPVDDAVRIAESRLRSDACGGSLCPDL
jgi:hypothetical protein